MTSTTLRNVDLLMSHGRKKSNQTSKQALPQSRASSAILPKKIAKRKYNCYHKISDNREQLYPCISKDNFWFNQQSSKILDMVFYYSKFCIPGEKHVLHVRCNHVTINCRKSVLRMTEWDKNDQDRYSDLSCTSFPPSNMIHTLGVLKPVNSYELHKVLPCWYL